MRQFTLNSLLVLASLINPLTTHAQTEKIKPIRYAKVELSVHQSSLKPAINELCSATLDQVPVYDIRGQYGIVIQVLPFFKCKGLLSTGVAVDFSLSAYILLKEASGLAKAELKQFNVDTRLTTREDRPHYGFQNAEVSTEDLDTKTLIAEIKNLKVDVGLSPGQIPPDLFSVRYRFID